MTGPNRKRKKLALNVGETNQQQQSKDDKKKKRIRMAPSICQTESISKARKMEK